MPCIDILILRLFLGDFRRGKRVLGIVTHFSLLDAKFKGFWGLLYFRVLLYIFVWRKNKEQELWRV